MDKKIALVLVFFLAVFAACYIFFFMNSEKDNNNSNSNSNSNVETKLIGDVSSVKLYQTDFKYDTEKKEYTYEEITLDDRQVSKIKEVIKNIDLNKNVSATVYGQYKLVVDDKIIFFDANNNYALYMGTNKEISFSNDIKKAIVNSTNTCSCCTTSNCLMNLCPCNN